MVEQGAEVAVTGLGGDSVDGSAVDRGGGGVASTQAVTRHRDPVEPCQVGSSLYESADTSRTDAFAGDVAVVGDPGEERSRSRRVDLAPGIEGADRIGQRVASASYPDQVAARVLIGLWSGEP